MSPVEQLARLAALWSARVVVDGRGLSAWTGSVVKTDGSALVIERAPRYEDAVAGCAASMQALEDAELAADDDAMGDCEVAS